MLPKKSTFLLGASFLLVLNCSTPKESFQSNSSPNIFFKDSLAYELCKIYGSDQGVRDMRLLTKETGAINFSPYLDSINFDNMVAFVKEFGIPSAELVGEDNFLHECVNSSLVSVLLHSPHRLVNEKKTLMVFVEEMRKGNLKEQTLITILDKYYWVKRDEYGNKKILYGSQFGKPCIKFREESDSVRLAIGLSPLPDSFFKKCEVDAQ